MSRYNLNKYVIYIWKFWFYKEVEYHLVSSQYLDYSIFLIFNVPELCNEQPCLLDCNLVCFQATTGLHSTYSFHNVEKDMFNARFKHKANLAIENETESCNLTLEYINRQP